MVWLLWQKKNKFKKVKQLKQFNPLCANFKLRAVHSVAKLKWRCTWEITWATCSHFMAFSVLKRAKMLWGKFDAVSEEDGGLLFYQFKIVPKREWTKTTEMEEDDENGECPQCCKAYFDCTAVAFRTKVYRLLFQLPLFHRLTQIVILGRVTPLYLIS